MYSNFFNNCRISSIFNVASAVSSETRKFDILNPSPSFQPFKTFLIMYRLNTIGESTYVCRTSFFTTNSCNCPQFEFYIVIMFIVFLKWNVQFISRRPFLSLLPRAWYSHYQKLFDNQLCYWLLNKKPELLTENKLFTIWRCTRNICEWYE